ncbi:MAG: hypothetical protein AVDCRST_MAG18-4169, partial [uncultured Thermomicrobiales bacterium]
VRRCHFARRRGGRAARGVAATPGDVPAGGAGARRAGPTGGGGGRGRLRLPRRPGQHARGADRGRQRHPDDGGHPERAEPLRPRPRRDALHPRRPRDGGGRALPRRRGARHRDPGGQGELPVERARGAAHRALRRAPPQLPPDYAGDAHPRGRRGRVDRDRHRHLLHPAARGGRGL